MVNIVEDWKEMAEYASYASRQTARAYQVIEFETREKKKKYLLRVQVGKFGFEQEFQALDDPLLEQITRYCVDRKFLNVSNIVQDDDFFKQSEGKAVGGAGSDP